MEKWEILVRIALENYAILNPKIDFIRHNENIICKVINQYQNKSYVLRIHKPTEGFSLQTVNHSYDDLTFELDFIQALYDNTDILMQKPIKNKDGDFITVIKEPSTAENIHVTLLSWVDGKVMHHEDLNWEEEAYLTGVLTAKMHQFSCEWSKNKHVNRQSYDKQKVEETIKRIYDGIELGLFSAEDFDILKQGCDKIIEFMDELDKIPNTKGFIHADIQKTNLIVHDKGITPIDFGLSGFGYFYMDLGGISADFGPLNIRKALLKGYQTIREIKEEDMKYIEGFFVYTILLAMATHLRNPNYEAWFKRRTSAICRDYIQPLIQNRRFYDNI